MAVWNVDNKSETEIKPGFDTFVNRVKKYLKGS